MQTDANYNPASRALCMYPNHHIFNNASAGTRAQQKGDVCRETNFSLQNMCQSFLRDRIPCHKGNRARQAAERTDGSLSWLAIEAESQNAGLGAGASCQPYYIQALGRIFGRVIGIQYICAQAIETIILK